MLTDLRIFFTVRLISKFATRLISYFPSHLQRVATLPCEKQYHTWQNIDITVPYC